MPRSAAATDPRRGWTPQADWREIRPGIWVPPGYSRSAWELEPPVLKTPYDAHREFARCRDKQVGLAYFALHYCWTLHVDDPAGLPVPLRLPAYPYLRELLEFLQEPRNSHSDKSRQLLTSWAYMAAFLYDVLFRRNWPALVSSRRAKEVDDGGENSTPDSLLGKLRYMHERLPPFLYQPLDYKSGMVTNPETGSYVRGETGTGGQVARGPAYRRGLMDEAAFQRDGEQRFAGFRQSCKNGLHMNSTVDGMGNVFARIRHSKTTTFKKLRFYWYRHPDKAVGLSCLCGWVSTPGPVMADVQFDAHRPKCTRKDGPSPTSPWYRSQQADLTPQQVASEVDINYEKSSAVRVFDAFDSSKHIFEVAQTIDRRTGKPIGEPRPGESELEYRRRVLPGLINPRNEILIFWDFGVSDEAAIFLGQVENPSSNRKATSWLDQIVDRGKGYDYYHQHIVTQWYPSILEACGYTPKMIAAWREKRQLDWSERAAFVPDLFNEVPRGCLPVYHAGDPAGRQRDSSLSSWVNNLAGADPAIAMHTVPFGDPADGSQLDWIDECRTIVRRGDVRVSTFCARLSDALGNWKWPTDRDGQILPGRQLPVHDKHSHPATAWVFGMRTKWRGMLTVLSKAARANQGRSHVVHELEAGERAQRGEAAIVGGGSLRRLSTFQKHSTAGADDDEERDVDDVDELYD